MRPSTFLGGDGTRYLPAPDRKAGKELGDLKYIYIYSFRILPGDKKRGDCVCREVKWGESGHEVSS
jgi:hypothetical protein